jgi:prepilin-type N-terminal cleavage/methylation domain-containing protein
MRRAGEQGVTLIELLVVLIVVSMALAIVVPSMSNSYTAWALRSSARKALVLFRLGSDIARKEGTDIAASYADHKIVLTRNGSTIRQLPIPESVTVKPEQPGGVVFLPSGQMIATQPFVFESIRGKKLTIRFGPVIGQISSEDATQ